MIEVMWFIGLELLFLFFSEFKFKIKIDQMKWRQLIKRKKYFLCLNCGVYFIIIYRCRTVSQRIEIIKLNLQFEKERIIK